MRPEKSQSKRALSYEKKITRSGEKVLIRVCYQDGTESVFYMKMDGTRHLSVGELKWNHVSVPGKSSKWGYNEWNKFSTNWKTITGEPVIAEEVTSPIEKAVIKKLDESIQINPWFGWPGNKKPARPWVEPRVDLPEKPQSKPQSGAPDNRTPVQKFEDRFGSKPDKDKKVLKKEIKNGTEKPKKISLDELLKKFV